MKNVRRIIISLLIFTTIFVGYGLIEQKTMAAINTNINISRSVKVAKVNAGSKKNKSSGKTTKAAKKSTKKETNKNTKKDNTKKVKTTKAAKKSTKKETNKNTKKDNTKKGKTTKAAKKSTKKKTNKNTNKDNTKKRKTTKATKKSTKKETKKVKTHEETVKEREEMRKKHPELNANYQLEGLNKAPRISTQEKWSPNGKNSDKYMAIKVLDGEKLVDVKENIENKDGKKTKRTSQKLADEKTQYRYLQAKDFVKGKAKIITITAKDKRGLKSKVKYKIEYRKDGKFEIYKSTRAHYSYKDGKLNIILTDYNGIANDKAELEIIDKNTNKTIEKLTAKELKEKLKLTTKNGKGNIVDGMYSININKLKAKNGKYAVKIKTKDGEGTSGSDMIQFKNKINKENKKGKESKEEREPEEELEGNEEELEGNEEELEGNEEELEGNEEEVEEELEEDLEE